MSNPAGTVPPGWSPFVTPTFPRRRRAQGPVEVIVFGSRNLRACYGCHHGRSQAEVALSFGRGLARRFGDRVRFRYVDINDEAYRQYPEVEAFLRGGRGRLPVVMIDGEIRFSSVFTPTFIQREIASKLRR